MKLVSNGKKEMIAFTENDFVVAAKKGTRYNSYGIPTRSGDANAEGIQA